MIATARRLADIPRAPVRLALALAGMLVLLGCSSLQIAYSFAEGALESRAETYLDLSAEQEAQVKQQSAALVAWHRREMLPKYAVFFRAQADIAEAGGWTRPQLAEAFARFRELLDETVEGAAPFIATVLAGHTAPEKLAHLRARIAENARERRDSHADEPFAKALDEWIERRSDRISRFTGPLDAAQLAIIRRHGERQIDPANRWIDNRETRERAFLDFMGAGPAEADIARFVRRIVLHAHEIVDPDYRDLSEARWARREELYFEVLETLSGAQRRELISTLRDYAEDMVELAGA